jgi:hypothetical protein
MEDNLNPIELALLAVSTLAMLTSVIALLQARRALAAVAAEKVDRLSAASAAENAARLTLGRIDAVEQRVGRGRRVTSEKRDRALELLAAGATEGAIARELELREAEVAVLARLRNRIGAGAD